MIDTVTLRLTLYHLKGVGTATIQRITAYIETEYGSVKELYTDLQAVWASRVQVSARMRQDAPGLDELDTAYSKAQATIQNCYNANILVFDPSNPQYPPLLNQIDNAPALLFVRGDIHVLHRPAVAHS
jgi:predicted Rossmann fold nucleotide-binding protein DprA/Smf involved in DNA uptake